MEDNRAMLGGAKAARRLEAHAISADAYSGGRESITKLLAKVALGRLLPGRVLRNRPCHHCYHTCTPHVAKGQQVAGSQNDFMFALSRSMLESSVSS